MRGGILVVLLLSLLSNSLSASVQNDKAKFDEFLQKFKKPYKKGTPEYNERFMVFRSSLRRQEKLNETRSRDSSAVYGVTKFSDLTPEEFAARYLSGYRFNRTSPQRHADTTLRFSPGRFRDVQIPVKIDWRAKKVVTDVGNQGQCGACWAFSLVETIESMYALKTGRLEKLSVQELIDCAREGNYGCIGGNIYNAALWLEKTQTPILLENEYPLTDKTDECKLPKPEQQGITVSHIQQGTFKGHEIDMLHMLQKGPLSVSVDAHTWNDYLGGIIQYHCHNLQNNHAVEVVGYDLSGEIPYYIVRNSWGADWGNDGYLYVKFGGNVCGLAEEVVSITF